MNRSGWIAVVVVGLVLLLGGWWLLAMNNQPATETTTPTNDSQSTPPTQENTNNGSSNEEQAPSLPDTSAEEGAKTITVSYTNNGFQPSNLGTIKAGDKVVFTNNSSGQMVVASDPHPAHSNYPEFESSSLGAGQSYTFTFQKTGTWGFHNHLNSSHKGTVTVQ
jgi:plastocyanin